MHALRCYFFLGSVFKVLEEMLMAADRMDEIDHFLGVLGYVLLLGFPLAPLSGTVIDFTMGFFVKSDMVSYITYISCKGAKKYNLNCSNLSVQERLRRKLIPFRTSIQHWLQ